STGATGRLAVCGLNTTQTRKISYQSPQLLLVCQPAGGHIACNESADLFSIYSRMLNRLADGFRCHIPTANTGFFGDFGLAYSYQIHVSHNVPLQYKMLKSRKHLKSLHHVKPAIQIETLTGHILTFTYENYAPGNLRGFSQFFHRNLSNNCFLNIHGHIVNHISADEPGAYGIYGDTLSCSFQCK